ncbi:MAG TPA: carboxylating nicotinate-nucleotide diphosphorylase [Acidimicrobiia bacterium]|nr:carboxylating nicotinate-nucleotide diphosphorylase [Acidimicrobiia bacterium]
MSDADPAVGPLREAVAAAVDEDLGVLGDLTSQAIIPEAAVGTGRFVARQSGVLAGTQVVSEVYRQFDAEVTLTWRMQDGDALAAGDELGRVFGRMRSILTGERTALNFLCHLSGVATSTRAFVDAAGDRVRILDTRKTLPGLRALEKAAVRAGGGYNHRASLSDALLIKDNHLVALGIQKSVQAASDRWPGRTVEVECERPEDVSEAIAAGAGIVMLDNMTPAEVKKCVALVRASSRPGVLIEVSGRVTLESVAKYAAAGPDLISTSAITQSAPALDLALDVEGEG